MDRIELIEKINELLNIGIHIGIAIGTYIYANHPKLVQEKATGLVIRIEKLSDEVLKKIIEIGEKESKDTIPFYLTLL